MNRRASVGHAAQNGHKNIFQYLLIFITKITDHQSSEFAKSLNFVSISSCTVMSRRAHAHTRHSWEQLPGSCRPDLKSLSDLCVQFGSKWAGKGLYGRPNYTCCCVRILLMLNNNYINCYLVLIYYLLSSFMGALITPAVACEYY